jgi:hypothetical protein
VKYDVELRLTRNVELEDSFLDGRGNVFTQMKDFIVKQSLSELGYLELGRQCRFFDLKSFETQSVRDER